MKCPKCLMEVKQEMKRLGLDTILVERMLSIVCNAAPTAPDCYDPCQCDSDWLINLEQNKLRDIVRRKMKTLETRRRL